MDNIISKRTKETTTPKRPLIISLVDKFKKNMSFVGIRTIEKTKLKKV